MDETKHKSPPQEHMRVTDTISRRDLLQRMSFALDDLPPNETIGYSNGVGWIEVATVEEIRRAARTAHASVNAQFLATEDVEFNGNEPSAPAPQTNVVEEFRALAKHYMDALCEIIVSDELEEVHAIAGKTLGSNPPRQNKAEPVAWLRHGEEVPVQNVPFGAMWITDKDDPRGFPVYAAPPIRQTVGGSTLPPTALGDVRSAHVPPNSNVIGEKAPAFTPGISGVSPHTQAVKTGQPDVDALRCLIAEIGATSPSLVEGGHLLPFLEYFLSLLVTQNHAAERGTVAGVPSLPPEKDVPVYRFLGEGDVIEATDEFIGNDGQTWATPVGWEVGMEYPSKVFKSARRLVVPASRQAGSSGYEGLDRNAQSTAAATITTQIMKSNMYVPIIDTPKDEQQKGETKVPPLEGNGPKPHNSPSAPIREF